MSSSLLLFALTLFTTLTNSHFVLQSPSPLGLFNDATESTGPCGGYALTGRNNITSYALSGIPIHLLSTHTKVTWIFRVALVNDTNSWVELVSPVAQTSIGDFCLPSVPGYAPWEGLDSVLQVVQFAPDGILYQCAAIVFKAGGQSSISAECKNSTNVAASFVAFTSTVPEPAGATLLSTSTVVSGSNSSVTTSSAVASRTSSATTTSKASIAGHGTEIAYGMPGFVLAVLAMMFYC